MKIMKFREDLSKQILAGTKTTTWRLFDDKDLSVGDVVSFFVWETGQKFACARIVCVDEKILKNLTDDDRDGHEQYVSDEQMYNELGLYYKCTVGPHTIVKVIKFEIL